MYIRLHHVQMGKKEKGPKILEMNWSLAEKEILKEVLSLC